MGYIYKITNSINGKMYVGQTRRDIETRWHEHLYYSHHKNRGYNCILHQAIRKYGDDAFRVEEIEKCDNILLMEREMYWIKELGTTKNGYNISTGGQGWNKCNDEDILALWNEGNTMKEIAKTIPLHPETISKRLQRMGISKQEILDRGNFKANRKKERAVYQYDLEGNYIRSFPSLHEAQASLGGRRIKFPPHAKEKQTCGYQWRKFKADKIEPVKYDRPWYPKPPMQQIGLQEN